MTFNTTNNGNDDDDDDNNKKNNKTFRYNHQTTSSPSVSTSFPRKIVVNSHQHRPIISTQLLSSSSSASLSSSLLCRRKWSLSTVIRCIYWIAFLLLVITTFLRTSVISNNLVKESSSNNNKEYSSTDGRPDVHSSFHQRIPSYVRGGTPASTGQVLPGLHNPRSSQFESSQELTQRRNVKAQQESNDDHPQRQVAGGNADKNVDWWAVLNKFESQTTKGYSIVKRYHESETSNNPPSEFVSKLSRLEQDLLTLANSTNDSHNNQEHRHTDNDMKTTNTTSDPVALDHPKMHLAKPPPDQPIDFQPRILPPPTSGLRPPVNDDGRTNNDDTNNNNSNMVVLVLSHQGSFIKRQAIRETWANRNATNSTNSIHSQVLFVVAQSNCRDFERDLGEGLLLPLKDHNVDEDETSEFNTDSSDGDEGHQRLRRRLTSEKQKRRHRRRSGKSDLNNTTKKVSTTQKSSLSSPSTLTCDEIDHNFLRLEQERYHDLLEIPMKEDYKLLPEKLLQAYHWVLNNLPHIEWIVKADDDVMVRVDSLQRYLRKYNSQIPMVIGDIVSHSMVPRSGKWAELHYAEDYYPFWPKGSAGHVVSRPVAKYFSDTSESLHRYQGEDVSVGIWLDEARNSGTLKDVTYIHANRMFTSDGKVNCERHKYMIIGHDFRPDELWACHNKFDGVFPEVAWLDDPSEFEEMIREEKSAFNWGDVYTGIIGNGRGPSSGHKNAYGTEMVQVQTGSAFGYKGKIPISS